MITRSLAMDLREHGFAVVTVNPGYVDTDMTHHQGMLTRWRRWPALQCRLRCSGAGAAVVSVELRTPIGLTPRSAPR
ncbi:hypothetical protein PI125_g11755 [Phytophthora idaei]|nr:hypothetical protein PI125_g11755 [Phytophthora idaei]